MRIEVEPSEAAAVYVGKGMELFQAACNVIGPHSCEGCPLSCSDTKYSFKTRCILAELKNILY